MFGFFKKKNVNLSWIEENMQKKGSCERCLHRKVVRGEPDRCSLTNHSIVKAIGNNLYYVRWNGCDGYERVRGCDTCGNRKYEPRYIAGSHRAAITCKYLDKGCVNASKWVEEKTPPVKIVEFKPKTENKFPKSKVGTWKDETTGCEYMTTQAED